MAFHRGRFDLLEQHLARDPGLITRTFSIQEIFPPEVGCGHSPYEAMGTPVDGGTLLHLAVYWDELDMAEWLLDRGADSNGRAAGHAALVGPALRKRTYPGQTPRGLVREHRRAPGARGARRAGVSSWTISVLKNGGSVSRRTRL
jgi:hypothetical protein